MTKKKATTNPVMEIDGTITPNPKMFDFPEAETTNYRKWKQEKRHKKINDWMWATAFIIFATSWVVWTTQAVTITCN